VYWFKLFSAVILAIFLFSACTIVKRKPSPNPLNPIRRVAILPMLNNTNEIKGAEVIREKMSTAFNDHYYNVQPLNETDQLLRDNMGITLGGQLDMVTFEQLRELLDVDGLLYGTLMDFKEITTGLYNTRKVRAKFILLNVHTGEIFWGKGLGVKSDDTSKGSAGDITNLLMDIGDYKDGKDEDLPWIDIPSYTENSNLSVEENLVLGLGKRLLGKMTNTTLSREIDVMIRRLVETLPWGPGNIINSTPPVLKMDSRNHKITALQSVGYMDKSVRDFTARSSQIQKINKVKY